MSARYIFAERYPEYSVKRFVPGLSLKDKKTFQHRRDRMAERQAIRRGTEMPKRQSASILWDVL